MSRKSEGKELGNGSVGLPSITGRGGATQLHPQLRGSEDGSKGFRITLGYTESGVSLGYMRPGPKRKEEQK